ncbi:MAG: YeeE/YedE thiosulfate transporter family protein [Chloroflexota bacterium]
MARINAVSTTVKRLIGWRIEPLTAGLMLGVLAVLAGQFSRFSALEHYGFCTTCHGHDLVVGLAQWFSLIDLSALTAPVIWPVFTTIGVVVGAWLSARMNSELPRVRPVIDWPNLSGRFLQGFLAMSFALLAMGCPIRMTVRAADLSPQGIIGLAGVAIGVSIGVLCLRIRAAW